MQLRIASAISSTYEKVKYVFVLLTEDMEKLDAKSLKMSSPVRRNKHIPIVLTFLNVVGVSSLSGMHNTVEEK